MTLILNAAKGEPALTAAAEILKRGGLVAFPTETVYGLGGLGLEPRALERIFAAKERPYSDPLILHAASAAGAMTLAQAVSEPARQLMVAFWPGPLTLVFSKSAAVPDLATAGLDSVAVRVPAHPVALALLERVAAPLAAPSANLFSRPSPTTARHVLDDLDGRIDAVLDGGPTPLGVESTVLDVREAVPVLLRPGGVSRAELERVLGFPIRVRERAAESGLRSPGLLEKHYSPRTELLLFEGEDAATLAALTEALAGRAPGTAGVLAYTEDLGLLPPGSATFAELGPRRNLEQVARSLYAALRQLDAAGVEVLLARSVSPGGLGDAINDRLRRAAHRRVVV